MRRVVVLENPRNWNLHLPEADVVSAREYLTDPQFLETRRVRVFNMCRTYSYQSNGYYVSLLAEARGHKPLPSVATLQDLRLSSVVRVVGEDLEARLQRAFAHLVSDRFRLSVYFGRNMAKRYDRICQALFEFFPAPFLRADFVKTDQWRLQGIRPVATSEIPRSHREFVAEQAKRYFGRPGRRARTRHRYDLAILVNPEERDPPSDGKAIRRFAKAAESVGLRPTLITREDASRLAEYDALFIRETTYVNNHTYRFARRADAEGMVVIDDPISILRCTNKVYQSELFEQHGIPSPRTEIVARESAAGMGDRLGYPCVVKAPDSSFSLGVFKAENETELDRHLTRLFEASELVVGQTYTPSAFDWRVGVLDGRALYVCKYYMARGHWQIQKAEGSRRRYGKVETFAVEEVPRRVVSLGTRAAGLIGNGFYGVDIKEIDGKHLVTEVNDNPSIEAGCEDLVLKDELYLAVMRLILRRLDARGRTGERA